VVELVWPNDPESYAGGSVTVGRASYARQVKGDDLNKKGYHDPPGCGLGVRLTTLPCQKYLTKASECESSGYEHFG